MDMDQRTRFLGGRAGRIILLGDGTEILTGHIHDDDGDVDMEDRGEAEDVDDDEDDQVPTSSQNKPNGAAVDEARSKREETPSPGLQGKNTEPAEKVEATKRQQAETGETEPKIAAATDNTDTKAAVEGKKN
jgi:protein phosphatase 2C family protein 2/3